MGKLIGGLVAVVLIGMFGVSMLPTAFNILGSLAGEMSTGILAVAPKVAVASLLLGLVLAIPHWTRHHAHGVIKYSILLGLLSGVVSVGMAWGANETAHAAPTAMNITTSLIGRIFSGFQAGVG